MRKLILVLGFLAIVSVSFNLFSCSKDDSDFVSYDYSVWVEMTEVDSAIYANARIAYLDDPANAGSAYSKILEFLSHNPIAVRTKAVENGTNYQFACRDYVVTVYKGNGDEIGKVIEIEEEYEQFPSPIPPDPRKRDTLIY